MSTWTWVDILPVLHGQHCSIWYMRLSTEKYTPIGVEALPSLLVTNTTHQNKLERACLKRSTLIIILLRGPLKYAKVVLTVQATHISASPVNNPIAFHCAEAFQCTRKGTYIMIFLQCYYWSQLELCECSTFYITTSVISYWEAICTCK